MSAHVEDRLSAWIDGDLPAEERTAVESHLGTCAACRAVAEELKAIDALARGAETPAPEGYFDALPGRVRARIEGRKRRHWHPPGWALAAAAALLLGVVTPITLRETMEMDEVERQQVQQAPRAAPVVPGEEAPESELTANAGDAEPSVQEADEAAVPQASAAFLREERVAVPDEGSEPPTTLPAPAAAEGASAFAAAPPPAPLPPPAATPAAEREPARALEESVAKQRRPSGVAAKGFTDASSDRLRLGETTARQQDLPASAAEARAERNALRARLAADDAADGGARALERDVAEPADEDAVRVRLIELSLRAWQLEGKPEDRDQLRRDAEAYLARPGAARPDYVRELLNRAG